MTGLTQKVVRGSALLLTAEVLNNACGFLRNLILARVLTKADFGVAATLGMVVSLVEIGGKMSFGQQVIQSKQGQDPEYLGTLQTFQLMAGVTSALAVLALAAPLGQLFDLAGRAWAIQLLAVVFLASGLVSLGPYRAAREMRFMPQILMEAVPQVAMTLAAWPLAAWLQDYRALLWLIIGKGLATMVISHLAGGGGFGFRFSARHAPEIVRFGWPLILSGFLMFAVFDGDRFLVASFYDMAQLGEYAVAASLAALPAMALLRVTTSIALPLFSAVQDDRDAFAARYSLFLQGLGLLGALFATFMITAGEHLVTWLYGAKYAGVGDLAACISIAQAVRIMRGAPALAAMSQGDTRNLLVGNLLRVMAIGGAIPLAASGVDLRWLALCAVAGELVALIVSSAQLSRQLDSSVRLSLRPLLVVVVAVAGAWVVRAVGTGSPGHAEALGMATVGCMAVAGLFLAAFPELRRQMQSAIPGLG